MTRKVSSGLKVRSQHGRPCGSWAASGGAGNALSPGDSGTWLMCTGTGGGRVTCWPIGPDSAHVVLLRGTSHCAEPL